VDTSPSFRATSLAEAATQPDGSLAIDPVARVAYWRGQPLDLSPTEFAVLACLHERLGQTVTYDEILQAVWGAPRVRGGSLAQVRSTVTRLRQKLGRVGNHTFRLVSVRTVGYRLDFVPAAQNERHPQSPIAPKPRRMVTWAGLAAVLLALLLAGWLLGKQYPGDPWAMVWYRGRQTPMGLLHILHRGTYCCVGPDGHPYCFDTKEERAAALGIPLRGVAPEVLEKLRTSGAVPDLRVTDE